ncbi:MAG: hypothetical protein HKN80_03410, partial [Acidimicrobiia bacterium]|nr:hypothetical protein [Acidimicrobiia bacterium]
MCHAITGLRRCRSLVIGILGILACSFATPAMAQHYRMRHYTGDDGLPQVQALSVYQDSRGYVWVGTYGGLARYDGSGFRVFGLADGLANNTVNVITGDPEGNVWFGTLGGVSIYDGKDFR